MKLVDSSIRYPITVAVGVILIALFGFISLFRIPVQLTPDVERPQVTVETIWPGASPQEVEREIVEEQEEQLKALDGLVRMTSESHENMGRVVLEFQVGTPQDASLLKVSNRLEQVRQYPQDAEKPVVTSVDVGRGAMAWFVLSFRPGVGGDISTMRDFAEDVIKPRFERVPGVAQSNVYGGRERELQVIVDPNKLAARGITLGEMAAALDRENLNTSGGDFDEGKRRYLVRTVGEYHSPADVERTIIAQRNGTPVYVRDVARAELGFKKLDAVVRHKDTEAIALNALRQTGTNVLETMAGLREAVAELGRDVLPGQGLRLVQVYDETEYIEDAIGLVEQNIVLGGLLAIGVLLVFLRSITSTLIIAAAIPISAVGTFLAMTLLGRNLNVVSLAGLAFAVGIVVDAAIVVLENIYRHRQLGGSRTEAAYEGTSQVWGAVLASTLTTVAVFLPVVYIQEEAGQLFRDIAIAVSCAVVLSLVVSITVIPTMAARILRIAQGGIASDGSRLSRLGHRFEETVTAIIERLLGSVRARLVVVVGMTAVSIGLSWLIAPKTEYLPGGNRNLIFGLLLPPPGYNLGELLAIGERLDSTLRPYYRAEPGSPEEARLEGPPVDNFFFVARGRMAFTGMTSREPERVKELIPIVMRPLGGVPGLLPIVQQASLFERGLAQGRTIDVEIHGPDLEHLMALGGQIFGRVHEVLPEAQVRPIPSLGLGNPEVQLVPDRERAAELGLSSYDLGVIVDVLVDGRKVSEYHYDGRKIDLTLMGDRTYARRTQDLEELPITATGGGLVTLGSVGQVAVTTGPEQINHIERDRAVVIQIMPPERMALEDAIERVEAEVLEPLHASGQLAGPYGITLAGTADKLTVTRQALQWNFVLALVITYLLMAALFESFLYPFVILFSVPLAALGGFLGLGAVNLLIAYQPLDILTMLGFVVLIGIVVNNAILIVHQALANLRGGGMAPLEAVRESVRVRIRPIFMSTTTSIFGMLPLILMPGSGSELYRGLGSVVVGGLALSTVFTLFLVPSLFSLVLEARERLTAHLHRVG